VAAGLGAEEMSGKGAARARVSRAVAAARPAVVCTNRAPRRHRLPPLLPPRRVLRYVLYGPFLNKHYRLGLHSDSSVSGRFIGRNQIRGAGGTARASVFQRGIRSPSAKATVSEKERQENHLKTIGRSTNCCAPLPYLNYSHRSPLEYRILRALLHHRARAPLLPTLLSLPFGGVAEWRRGGAWRRRADLPSLRSPPWQIDGRRRRGTGARQWWWVLRRALELASADACPRRRGRGGCPCGGQISSTVAPSPASPATTSSSPGAKSCLGLLPGGEVEVRVPVAGGSRPPSRPLSHLRWLPPRLAPSHSRLHHGRACSRFELPRHGAPDGAGSGARRAAEVELDRGRNWSSTGGGGGVVRPSVRPPPSLGWRESTATGGKSLQRRERIPGMRLPREVAAKCSTRCGNYWRRYSGLPFFIFQMQCWMQQPLESVSDCLEQFACICICKDPAAHKREKLSVLQNSSCSSKEAHPVAQRAAAVGSRHARPPPSSATGRARHAPPPPSW
jgi:hypothetical protein